MTIKSDCISPPGLFDESSSFTSEDLIKLKSSHAFIAAIIARMEGNATENNLKTEVEIETFNKISSQGWVDKESKQAFVTIQDPGLEGRFHAHVGIRVGGRFETESLAGISHYLEHCVFLGSRLFPSPGELELAMLRAGGDVNASTTMNETVYTLSGNDEKFEAAIKTLLDMVFFPRLVQRMDKEKEVVLCEINEYCEKNGEIIEPLSCLNKMLYGAHPVANMIVGTKESVGAVSPALIKAFHKYFYTPQNSIVVLSSARSHEQMQNLITAVVLPEMAALQKRNAKDKAAGMGESSRACKVIKERTRTFAAFDVKKQLYLADSNERVLIQGREVSSTMVSVILKMILPKTDRKYWAAAQVLTNILFSTEMSLIFGTCRKAGLLYRITGDVEFPRDGAFMSIEFEAKAEKIEKIFKKIGTALRQLSSGSAHISEEFFQMMHQNAMYDYREAYADSSNWADVEMSSFGEWGHSRVLPNRAARLSENLGKIENVKMEDVVSLASLVRASPRVAVHVQGDVCEQKAFISRLRRAVETILDEKKLEE